MKAKLKKKNNIFFLKKDSKKQLAVFSVWILFTMLVAIIFVNSGLEGINKLSDKFLMKSGLQKITNLVVERFSALAEEAPQFFFPQFPKRLMYAVSDIYLDGQDLISLNEELLEFVNNCDCAFTQSQCKQVMASGQQTACNPGPIKTFGEPCPDYIRVNDTQTKIQSDINNFTLKVAFVRQLLTEEMNSGLEEQLQTLRPEDAQALRDNLAKILELSPNIADLARNNIALPNECLATKCSPNCQQGASFTLQACLKADMGQQKPIEAKFGVGVTLDDLKLGKIGIKNINLSLPDKLQLSTLPQLPSIDISIPDITFSCPAETQALTFQTPSPSLPEAPTLTLGCPVYSGDSSYDCVGGGREREMEFEWYSQIISWLSEQCQQLPGMRDSYGFPTEINQVCFDIDHPENIIQAITDKCEELWVGLLTPAMYNALPEVCRTIGKGTQYLGLGVTQILIATITGWWDISTDYMLSLTAPGIIEKECKDLFQSVGETPPSECNVDDYCTVESLGLGGRRYDCYAMVASINQSLQTTENKCDELAREESGEVPEPCKVLPLFLGQLENPGTIVEPGESCPSQEIGDFPNPVAGCSFSFPTIPKISFPKIIIPDIYLPSFSLPPFFSIKLPNFIFEDLIIPDIELCNLDDCQFKFPYLTFKVPSLKIPQVEVPAVRRDIPGLPSLEVKVAPIQFPPLRLQLPQLFNLLSLTTPELEMPSIALPQPKLQMSFKGLEVDLMELLLGLLDIPSVSVCISLEIKFIAINLVYPDYIFDWPAFPQIPEIPFCKSVNEFCQNANASIQEIKTKTSQIQNQVNTVFQSEIQQRLDLLGQIIEQALANSIQGQLDEIADRIQQAIINHLATNLPEYAVTPEGIPVPGVWPVERKVPCDKIPPLTMPGGDIITPTLSLSSLVYFPSEISIPWPESLKKLTLTNALDYDLPTIPLSNLSYSKEVNIRLPGLQRSSPSISFDLLENATACYSQQPSGGNPCPTGQIQSNLDGIRGIASELQQASQNIQDILE